MRRLSHTHKSAPKEQNSLHLQTAASRLTSLLHDWLHWWSHPGASCDARGRFLPQPSSTAVARPRQEASTFKHMQPSQQTHRVLMIATHMFCKAVRKFLHNSSTNTPPRSGFDQSVSDHIRCVSIKKCCSHQQFLILHHEHLRSSATKPTSLRPFSP